jgi:hypothetical protein
MDMDVLSEDLFGVHVKRMGDRVCVLEGEEVIYSAPGWTAALEWVDDNYPPRPRTGVVWSQLAESREDAE